VPEARPRAFSRERQLGGVSPLASTPLAAGGSYLLPPSPRSTEVSHLSAFSASRSLTHSLARTTSLPTSESLPGDVVGGGGGGGCRRSRHFLDLSQSLASARPSEVVAPLPRSTRSGCSSGGCGPGSSSEGPLAEMHASAANVNGEFGSAGCHGGWAVERRRRSSSNQSLSRSRTMSRTASKERILEDALEVQSLAASTWSTTSSTLAGTGASTLSNLTMSQDALATPNSITTVVSPVGYGSAVGAGPPPRGPSAHEYGSGTPRRGSRRSSAAAATVEDDLADRLSNTVGGDVHLENDTRPRRCRSQSASTVSSADAVAGGPPVSRRRGGGAGSASSLRQPPSPFSSAGALLPPSPLPVVGADALDRELLQSQGGGGAVTSTPCTPSRHLRGEGDSCLDPFKPLIGGVAGLAASASASLLHRSGTLDWELVRSGSSGPLQTPQPGKGRRSLLQGVGRTVCASPPLC